MAKDCKEGLQREVPIDSEDLWNMGASNKKHLETCEPLKLHGKKTRDPQNCRNLNGKRHGFEEVLKYFTMDRYFELTFWLMISFQINPITIL